MTPMSALKRIDHVRMFVGNARQSAYFYRNAFGFEVVAYAGLETGVRHEACYVLRQGHITFVLASPLRADHPDAHRLIRHGDGVQSIALEVDDVPAAFEAAVARGREARYAAPDDRGRVRRLRVRRDPRLWRHDAHVRRPLAVSAASSRRGSSRSTRIDTAPARSTRSVSRRSTTSSPTSRKGRWATGSITTARSWASRCWPASTTRTSAPSYSALMSKVVADGRGRIKFPINEPAKAAAGRRSRSSSTTTAGRACSTSRWRPATSSPASVPWPPTTSRSSRCRRPITRCCRNASAPSAKTCDELAELGILVDRDDEGYLLQIFTKPVEDRPTLFFEIIQRRGAKSFGKGNFKALFEAIEREQARRGTL